MLSPCKVRDFQATDLCAQTADGLEIDDGIGQVTEPAVEGVDHLQ